MRLLGWVLIKWSLIERTNKDTETPTLIHRPLCGNEGRDQGALYATQRVPEMASKPPETWREAWDRFHLTGLRRNNPDDTLLVESQPTDT